LTHSVLIHLTNEDPILAEVEALPSLQDQILIVQNPRRRDGKDVHYLLPDVAMMLLPWHRISFIEVIPTGTEEEVVTFVRE
jgi:hypothetical protein